MGGKATKEIRETKANVGRRVIREIKVLKVIEVMTVIQRMIYG